MNFKKKIIKEKKEKNIGIEILRIYLSILVVNTHCFKNSNEYHLLLLKMIRNQLHVPTFIIISFYFFQNSLFSRNLEKYKQRFQRLLIPYILWSFIIWILNCILDHYFKIGLKHSFKDLKKQLLTGHCLNTVFWFQWNLIFLTFFYIIIELTFNKYIINILLNIGLIAYFFQYSHYNYNLFFNLEYEIKYTFGRFVEMIPYSISGLFFAYFKLFDYFKKNRIKIIDKVILIFILISRYNFIFTPIGFGYSGFYSHILSICLFIFFSLLSSKFVPQKLIKMIIPISKCTPGIYYLHYPIMLYLKNIFYSIKYKRLDGAILIYIICYFISIAGNIIFRKSQLINLFQ